MFHAPRRVVRRDLLEAWLAVQRRYLFLEPLFSSESLLRKMPIEGRSFGVVDQSWCHLLERLGPRPRALEARTRAGGNVTKLPTINLETV